MCSTIKYRPDIDALRAIAVIFVVLFHLNEEILPAGFIGVDIFFVISGYLITRIILKNCESNNFSFTNFYARRTKRIFPALFVVLLASGLLAVISLPHDIYESFFKSFKYASMQLSNFFFARKVGYFDDTGSVQPLLHSWSLGVEEQFYIIWPLIIFALSQVKNFSRKTIFWIFTFLLLVSWFSNLYLQNINSQKAFYMFYTRAWEFCFGAIVALEIIPHLKNKITNTIIAFIGALMVFMIAFYEGSSSNYMQIVTTISSLGAALIIYSGQKNTTIINQLLSIKPLVFVGLISYSLYLWHWPAIVFFKQIFGQELNLVNCIIISTISVLLAILSYYLIEQKTRYIDSISDKKVLALGVGTILVFVGLSSVMTRFSEANWRLEKPNTEKAGQLLEMDKEFFELPENIERELESPDILVIGDSHSLHYFPIIYKKALAKNLSTAVIDEDGCPPLLGDHKIVNLRANRVSRDVKDGCELLKNRILTELKKKSVKHVFIAMRQAVYTETKTQKGFGRNNIHLTNNPNGELSKEESREIFSEALEYTVQYIQSLGIKVHLLGQVPTLLSNPNRCAETTLIDKLLHDQAFIKNRQTECYSVNVEYVENRMEYSHEEYSRLATKYNLEYFSSVGLFSSALSDDEVILYRDDNHLNYSGMRVIYDNFSADF